MEVSNVVEQIIEYCSCQDIDEKDVIEAIDIVSIFTGWAYRSCETFLTGERKEVIEIPRCVPCGYEFKPYYWPYDTETFTFTLIKQRGIVEESEPIEFVYSEVDEVFRLDLPNDCCCGGNEKCGCPTKYKILVTYEAGYDFIPDCLLPVFCEIVRLIHEKNLCCKSSCACDGTVDEEESSSESLADFKKIIREQYKRQLGMISLYKEHPEVWGAVI